MAIAPICRTRRAMRSAVPLLTTGTDGRSTLSCNTTASIDPDFARWNRARFGSGPKVALDSPTLKRVVLYAVVGGLLVALLKLLEYQHFARAYPTEIYVGLVALIFTAVGIYFGLRWTRRKEVVVVREVRVREG